MQTKATPAPDAADSSADRREWLSLLARANPADLAACLRQAPELPPFTRLRGPEAGLVMLRGRLGGSGDMFNFGEMTLARCSICDSAGRVGHGYAAGRDLAEVELIARLDAVLQDPALAAPYRRAVLAPLAAREAARRTAVTARAAATRVDFFTLATMR